ncbi:AMP nucleosidase, partial [Stenotrophomonas maltophilia]
RYTGVPLEQFGQNILLTNFGGYLNTFSELTGAQVIGLDRPMARATIDGINIFNFGMGSPYAASIYDLISAGMP